MANYDTPFEAAVARARRLGKKVNSQLVRLEGLVKRRKMEEAFLEAFEVESTAEDLTLLARSLPCYTGHPAAKDEVEETLSEEIPVEIGYTGHGWFTLRIPMLLPKKEKGSPEYIRGFLYPALKRYFRYGNYRKFDDCVLIYRHVYDEQRPEREYRDHDNIELNAVTDAVAMYVMTDDCPLRCRHYYCSAAGPADWTEVYVVPVDEFRTWLEQEPCFPKVEVLIANPPEFRPQKDGDYKPKPHVDEIPDFGIPENLCGRRQKPKE